MWLFCNQLKQVRYLHWTVKLFRGGKICINIFVSGGLCPLGGIGCTKKVYTTFLEALFLDLGGVEARWGRGFLPLLAAGGPFSAYLKLPRGSLLLAPRGGLAPPLLFQKGGVKALPPLGSSARR